MCSLASGSSYHHETCSSTYYRFSHMVDATCTYHTGRPLLQPQRVLLLGTANFNI